MRARSSSLTPSLPASPLETETVLIPSRFAISDIANGGNADGVAYNKRVWTEAGITEVPATPDEFLDDLQIIKDNTDAIPLYINFAAGWTMGAWDAYIFGSATGDPEFHNNMPHMASPFADRGDGTGPYAATTPAMSRSPVV